MKIFVQLLAVYFVALSLLPCQDGMGACDVQHSTPEEVVELSHCSHSSPEPCEDSPCSSICSCACCGTTVYLSSLSLRQPIIADHFLIENCFDYHSMIDKPIAFSIWQPPKMS